MKRWVIINVTVSGKVSDAALNGPKGFYPCIPHQYPAADPDLAVASFQTVKGNSRIQTDVHSTESGIFPYPFYQPDSRRIDTPFLGCYHDLPLFRRPVCQHALNVLILVIETTAHFAVTQMTTYPKVQKGPGRDL